MWVLWFVHEIETINICCCWKGCSILIVFFLYFYIGYMHFVENAYFYFEAETDLDSFLYQRRRWINGTMAGFLFLLFEVRDDFWKWKKNIVMKIFTYIILWICQIQMFGVIISPAISFTILFQGLKYLIGHVSNYSEILVEIIMLLVWIVWVGHVIIHNKRKFHTIIIQCLYVISMLTSFSLALSYIWILIDVMIKNNGKVNLLKDPTAVELFVVDSMSIQAKVYVLLLMLFVTIGPFIANALMTLNLVGFKILLKTCVAYFLSFHMIVPWFSSYAFARCWDLSWGNRPLSQFEIDLENSDIDIHNINKHSAAAGNERGRTNSATTRKQEKEVELIGGKFDENKIMRAKFLQYSRMVALGILVLNLFVYFLSFKIKAWIMCGLLSIVAFFILTSLTIYTIKFPQYFYQTFVLHK